MDREFRGEREASINNNIPEVYRLIERGASIAELVQQSYLDFSQNNLEAVSLGLEEILSHGNEGIQVLKTIARSTDELGSAVNKVLLQREWSAQSIAEALGTNRYGQVFSGAEINELKTLEFIHAYCLKVGLIDKTLTFEGFLEERNTQIDNEHNTFRPAPHVTGEIESHTISTSSTFGVEEPNYIELSGPREILRLRAMNSPQFLLLGSYGPYSAKEMTAYAKKINPEAKVNVIDNSMPVLSMIKKVNSKETRIAGGDATMIPLQDQSIDHVYTSHLLRFMNLSSAGFTNRAKDIFLNPVAFSNPGEAF